MAEQAKLLLQRVPCRLQEIDTVMLLSSSSISNFLIPMVCHC